jgi:signal transduction histidine kinase/DNA-binding response OmpR family regulator
VKFAVIMKHLFSIIPLKELKSGARSFIKYIKVSMGVQKEKTYLESTLGKIIAGVLLGSVALMVYWSSTNLAFNEVLITVEKISEPNEKLDLVNQLFRDIIKLDQQQRKMAAEKPDDSRIYNIQYSEHIYREIDSLKFLLGDNSTQTKRIDSMIFILEERDRVFLNYLSLRSDLMTNKSLSTQVQSLARLLSDSKSAAGDIAALQRQNKITRTTTIIPSDTITVLKEPENETVLQRIFGSRRASEIEHVATPTTIVEEEIQEMADSIKPGINDSLATVIEQRIRNIERRQQDRSSRLLESELEFLIVSDYLISELLDILKAIEKDELAASEEDKIAAFELVNEALDRSTLLLIVLIAGAFALLYFIAIDISKSKKYRRQLSKAKDAAENLSQVKQRFLANMSHEIRTPLQSILGFSEQLRNHPESNPEALEAIHKSSLYLLQIVNEILDYSRIISGKFKFDEKPFELKQLLEDIADVMKTQANKKGLKFQFDNNITEPLALNGDAFRLQQILYNLLGNAIKYTERGSILLMVVATGKKDKTTIEILVEDSGIGIDKEDLKRIFNEFEQADTNKKKSTSGTGLGLSIVNALVEAQHGIIAADSIVGKGTSFIVRLNYKNAALEEVKAPPVFVPALTRLQHKRVLVIDDDPFIIKLCSLILKKTGADFRTIVQRDQQVSPDESWVPDIVLTDIRMVGRSGFEWLKILRTTFTESLPVIAMTAQTLPEEIEELKSAGFNAHLKKPFTEVEMITMLEQFALQQAIQLPAKDSATAEIISLSAELLDHFIDETNNDLKELDIALTENDRDKVINCLHRLAGRTGQVGLKSTYIAIRKAEIGLVRGGNLNDYRDAISAAEIELSAIVKSNAQLRTAAL